MAIDANFPRKNDYLSRILGPGPRGDVDPGYERAIAQAAGRLTQTAEEMTHVAEKIDDTAVRGELQRLILEMLSDVRTVSQAIVPIAQRRTGAG